MNLVYVPSNATHATSTAGGNSMMAIYSMIGVAVSSPKPYFINITVLNPDAL